MSEIHSNSYRRDPAGILAVVVAIAFAMILAWRPISNADLGYHLAFGEQIVTNGEITDVSDDVCYTVDRQTSVLGPGQWWGNDGKMLFTSANWGTQLVMFPIWEHYGPTGLTVLKTILVGLIFFLIAMINWRFGVANWLNAICLVLIALAGYERFNIRPELFSYTLILCQFHLLLNIFAGKTSKLGWKTIILMAIVQLTMVTMHSFFIFTWLLLGLLLAETLLAAGVYGILRRREIVLKNYRLAINLTIALFVMIAVSFINPWTWRLVVLPFQLFISSEVLLENNNPYQRIGEITSPFVPGAWNQTLTLKAYIIVLCFTAVGAIAGVFRRCWAMLVLMALLFTMTLTMRRNILLGAMIMVPVAAGCLWWFAEHYLTKQVGRVRFALKTTLAAGVIIFTAFMAKAVISNELYFNDRRNLSFGTGLSSLSIPIEAANWINENRPVGTIWCDFDSSSNAYYFITPHPPVPVLTNTWAAPLSSMSETINAATGMLPWSNIQKKYNPQTVLIKTSQANHPLLSQLQASNQWTLVYLGAQYAVFIHSDGINAQLARLSAINQDNFNVDKFISQIEKYNDITPLALQAGAVTLQRLGWFDKAIEMSKKIVKRYSDYHEAWFEIGATYCLRGSLRNQRGQFKDALEDFNRGRECFEKCLEIEPTYFYAKLNLEQVKKDIRQTKLLAE